MEYTVDERLEIIKRIEKKSVRDQNGCLIWKGKTNKFRLTRVNCIRVYRFIWNHYHPDDQLKINEPLRRLCDNDKCNEISHLEKIISCSRTDQEVWDIILKKCERNVNGCLIWKGVREMFSITRDNVISVYKFTWNYHYPDNKLKNYEIIKKTCNNPKCNELTHFEKYLPHSKQEIWNRLLKHGKHDIETGCLIWYGPQSNNYGISNIKGKTCYTHRMSYWIHNDEYETIDDIPKRINGERMVIRHNKCFQNLCFEPSHLKLGTDHENQYEDRIADNTLCRGEKNGQSTITEETAMAIKLSKYPIGHKNYKTVKIRANEFDVSIGMVNHIDSGTTWSHLLDANGNNHESDNLSRNTIKRKAMQNGRNAVWTDDMWEEAKKRILSRSKYDTKKNKFTGTRCLLWQGQINKDGYGLITCFKKRICAHTLSCGIKNKKHLPEGQVTRHLCGGAKNCVRPSHLKFGTNRQNAIDRLRHGTKNAKITEKQALQIRKLHETGKYKRTELATKLNISQAIIGSVINRKSWTHI